MGKASGFDAIEEARQNWSSQWPEIATNVATASSIMRAQQIVLGAVDVVLRPLGLTFARYEALALLSFTKSGSLPMGKMGERLMIHPTSVTNIIDRLSKDELVERIPHPGDGRATLAQITPKGRALAKEATEAVNGVRFGVGSLSEEDQEDLIRVINQLRRATGELA